MKKGFTLIEILVVVLIVGILMIALLIKLGDQTDKAREAGLKDIFRVYTISTEYMFRENLGMQDKTDLKKNLDWLNDILAQEYKLTPVEGSDATKVVGTSEIEDPWGTKYRIEFETGLKNSKITDKIYIKSYGREGYYEDRADEYNKDTNKPYYVMLTQFYDNSVMSCTVGLYNNINYETSNSNSIAVGLDGTIPDYKNLDCFDH